MRPGWIVTPFLAAWVTGVSAISPIIADQPYRSELNITLDGGQPDSPPAPRATRQPVQLARRPEFTPTRRSNTVNTGVALRTPARAHSSQPSRAVTRLGVVQQEGTPIYRTADRRSQVLFRCNKGGALGLVGQTPRYYAVLMIDRSLGFIEKSRVELYNYGVAADPEAGRASERIIQVAFQYMGVPYVWGGTSRQGIDCSGFVRAVFNQLGVALPRVAREQFNVGQAVRWGELAPGDRLYFCTKHAYIDHTGIYIGGGRFIHASGGAGAVVVSSVTEPKFFRTLVGARRS